MVYDADTSFFTTGFLTDWLKQHGLTTVAHYGVFCLYNHYSVSESYKALLTLPNLLRWKTTRAPCLLTWKQPVTFK